MKLITYLEKTGETPDEFAARTGIPVVSIYSYKNEHRIPSRARIKKIRSFTFGKVSFEDWPDKIKTAKKRNINSNEARVSE